MEILGSLLAPILSAFLGSKWVFVRWEHTFAKIRQFVEIFGFDRFVWFVHFLKISKILDWVRFDKIWENSRNEKILGISRFDKNSRKSKNWWQCGFCRLKTACPGQITAKSTEPLGPLAQVVQRLLASRAVKVYSVLTYGLEGHRFGPRSKVLSPWGRISRADQRSALSMLVRRRSSIRWGSVHTEIKDFSVHSASQRIFMVQTWSTRANFETSSLEVRSRVRTKKLT